MGDGKRSERVALPAELTQLLWDVATAAQGAVGLHSGSELQELARVELLACLDRLPWELKPDA